MTQPYVECMSGWDKIIDPLIKYCEEHNIQIDQVKEKFGALRFYIDSGPDELYDMINKAEALSEITCEYCGEPGTIKGPGWLKCYCEKHHEERKSNCEAL